MKHLKTLFAFGLIFLFILIFGCSSTDNITNNNNGSRTGTEASQVYLIPASSNAQTVDFKEVWGYVIGGREHELLRGLPVTDVAHFSAAVDAYGNLVEVPRRSAIPSHFTGRVHLAFVCNGYGLTHFVMKQGTPERKKLITDLVAATRPYDGLNIDMENVPGGDYESFAAFVRDIRAELPRDKMFTVCVPARTRKLQNDIFDYDRMASIFDRVFVMAYDEHWSGSRAGSVASISWCRSVADYSVKTIGRDKLIMGLPFYGRTWGDYSPSRALTRSGIEEVIRNNNITDIKYENDVPTFSYTKTVTIKVYYEDEHSLVTRMNMYKTMGVNNIGFWRIGQEGKDFWQHLRITPAQGQSVTQAPPAPPPAAPAVTPAAPEPAPAAQVPAAAPAPRTYTVLRGDSLWGIARYFGVSVQALAEANNMNINDTLWIGRVLRIP